MRVRIKMTYEDQSREDPFFKALTKTIEYIEYWKSKPLLKCPDCNFMNIYPESVEQHRQYTKRHKSK